MATRTRPPRGGTEPDPPVRTPRGRACRRAGRGTRGPGERGAIVALRNAQPERKGMNLMADLPKLDPKTKPVPFNKPGPSTTFGNGAPGKASGSLKTAGGA